MKEYSHEFADIWHNVPSELQTMGGVWIIRVGRNVAKPNYHVGPKMIECHSLHFVLEGKVMLESDEKEIVLQKGDMFCLFPHKSYTYKTISLSSTLRLAWLALEGRQVPALIRHVGLIEETPYLRQTINREVRGILRQILGLFDEGAAEGLLSQSLLYRLFGQLRAGAGQATEPHAENNDWLRHSVDYFRLHYTEQVKIEVVAKLAGVHRSHFTAVFTKEMGISPVQYLQRLRMNKGAQLLKETSLNITEIALSLGYSDLYSFTRAFTKYYGVSPSTYRK